MPKRNGRMKSAETKRQDGTGETKGQDNKSEKREDMMCRKKNQRYQVMASFTVEAAFIMPVVILLLAWTMQLAVGLYGKVEAESADLTQIEKIDSVSQFKRLEAGKALLETVRN